MQLNVLRLLNNRLPVIVFSTRSVICVSFVVERSGISESTGGLIIKYVISGVSVTFCSYFCVKPAISAVTITSVQPLSVYKSRLIAESIEGYKFGKISSTVE